MKVLAGLPQVTCFEHVQEFFKMYMALIATSAGNILLTMHIKNVLHISPKEGSLVWIPTHPPANPSLVTYFPLKGLTLGTQPPLPPPPLKITINFPWRKYGYFLEPHDTGLTIIRLYLRYLVASSKMRMAGFFSNALAIAILRKYVKKKHVHEQVLQVVLGKLSPTP